MRKPLSGLIFILFSLSSAADAATWVEVEIEKFIDTSSMQKSGQSVTFWVKVNYAERDKYGALSSKYQMRINCKTREHLGLYWIDYDDTDNTGRVLSSTKLSTEWTPISPDSSADEQMKFVCR